MLLIENTELTINPSQLEESQEPTSDNQIVFHAVPIWRLGEKNLNGRTYPIELGERLVEQSPITYSYNNHPIDETSSTFNDVKAIAKKPQIIEGNLCVDLYIVEQTFGDKVQKIIRNGSKVGLSSVGYGELDENNVIIPETYQLVRFCDFVLNPSYQVYITQQNGYISEPQPEETAIEETSDLSEETAVSISEEELQEINIRFKTNYGN